MVLSTQLGMAAAGAFQAMLSIHNLAFALSMGFGSAAGVRVGNAVGAGLTEEAWPRSLIAAGLATATLVTLSIILVAGARLWVLPFSDDRQVIAPAASMLAIMGAFLLFDGLQYVFGAALRSLGEQIWAGVNGIIGFFIVTGGLGSLLVGRGWGAAGLAYAAGMGMLVCALLQFGRLAWVLRKWARTSG
jgi:MATE family multidrug resistance protein